MTEDRDIHSGKPSELGQSCQESTATRRLLESFANRVYLVKRYEDERDSKLKADIEEKRSHLRKGKSDIVFDDPSAPNHTKYCHSVRPIDDLIDDLKRWKAEIPA